VANLEKNLRKAESDCGHLLRPNEEFLWFDAYGVAITNARIIGFRRPFSEMFSSDPLDVYLSVSISEVNGVRYLRKKLQGYFAIGLKNSTEELLQTVASEKDIASFKAVLESAQRDPLSVDFEPIVSTNAEARIAEKRNEIAAAKAEAKAATTEAKEERKLAEQEKWGEVAVSAPFGTRWVTIYSKGYIKVSSGLGLMKGDVEKLLDIFGESDITKKSGLGRAAGAVFTMGANITLSPNQRGNLYLTIATEKNTHSLMWDRPDATSIKNMNKLVSAGKAAIARGRVPSGVEASSPTQSRDLSDQLAQLAKLHATGVLSDDEFSAAKAKLLGN
jgi:hypothetical protein